MCEVKQVKQYNATCHSTEEYQALVTQIQEQGGRISHTFSMTNGRGISVQYVVPSK